MQLLPIENIILVTSYTGPDLDGFACAFAYAEFLNATGIKSVYGFMEIPHVEALYLVKKYEVPFVFDSVDPTLFDKIIMVDASDVTGIDQRINLEKVIEVIDHRKVNDQGAFKNAKIQIELVGSAATLIAEKFINQNISITKQSAALLYGAIISNTLNFKANVTTDRDKMAAVWLKNIFNPASDFVNEMFRAKSNIDLLNLKDRLEGDFAQADLGKKVGIAQLEITNAELFLQKFTANVVTELLSLKERNNLDYIFLSVLDLDNEKNYFISPDGSSEEFLRQILNLDFVDHCAQRDGFIMRKEIWPLIKASLS